MAPRPQSQARLKLSSASVVSTTSCVSMNTSFKAISSWGGGAGEGVLQLGQRAQLRAARKP